MRCRRPRYYQREETNGRSTIQCVWYRSDHENVNSSKISIVQWAVTQIPDEDAHCVSFLRTSRKLKNTQKKNRKHQLDSKKKNKKFGFLKKKDTGKVEQKREKLETYVHPRWDRSTITNS